MVGAEFSCAPGGVAGVVVCVRPLCRRVLLSSSSRVSSVWTSEVRCRFA